MIYLAQISDLRLDDLFRDTSLRLLGAQEEPPQFLGILGSRFRADERFEAQLKELRIQRLLVDM